MSIRISACGLALAACFVASAASAATVTVTFEGNTNFGSGPFLGTAGATHTLEVVGQSDAMGSSAASIPDFFNIGGGSATSYMLDSMTYALPDEGLSFTSTDVTAYVGNNVSNNVSGDVVDGIAIFGSVGTRNLSYFAEFSAMTWDDDSTQEAIVAALTTAFTQGRGAGVSAPGGSAFGVINILDVVVDQGTTPPTGGGGMAGGGGSSGGGGGTPTPAPVPLPAGAPLLIAGLGALAWLRRRR